MKGMREISGPQRIRLAAIIYQAKRAYKKEEKK
jgi:hypothetical protein